MEIVLLLVALLLLGTPVFRHMLHTRLLRFIAWHWQIDTDPPVCSICGVRQY